jgi:hypothetical protein
MSHANLFSCLFATVLTLSAGALHAQQPAPEKPRVETPAARLANAKNVLVMHTRGNSIPFDVIRDTVDGWGRFTLVEAPDQADLLIQVSTSGGDSDVRVTSSSGQALGSGKYEQSNHTSRDLSATDVKLIVLDAKNRRVLWEANETAKYAMKEKARENNLVEAAQRLASKLHERLEPPPPPSKEKK